MTKSVEFSGKDPRNSDLYVEGDRSIVFHLELVPTWILGPLERFYDYWSEVKSD